MSSTDLEGDNIAEFSQTLLMLKRPTDINKVIDSIPKPAAAVPKNGLPLWYKMGLENKLPVPRMPQGKVVFSRGKVGEDVRRIEIGAQPSFDLTDPYCYNISYEYVPVHDPNLAHFFAQKQARNLMKQLGYVTKDGRAVCSLKEFNQYRKYLYNRYVDRIRTEIKKLDELAQDSLILSRVERDVARRQLIFNREERAREQFQKLMAGNASAWSEKMRIQKEKEDKIKARLQYLEEYNNKVRNERNAKAKEQQTRVKQRVQAANELELKRKIRMIRTWRVNEKKRQNRAKKEAEEKRKKLEDDANAKWATRIRNQTQKIQEKAILLRIYTEDMAAAAERRNRLSQKMGYQRDLELARIRLANLRALHGGGTSGKKKITRKMGVEFEKTKRGLKGMCLAKALAMAQEAMNGATSTEGDPLMTLGQARVRMDIQTQMPTAPIFMLDELMEAAIFEFARRRVTVLLKNVEIVTKARAALVFFQNFRPVEKQRKTKQHRWSRTIGGLTAAPRKQSAVRNSGDSVVFGEIVNIPAEVEAEHEMKSVKDRPPTPIPSLTELVDAAFDDGLDDLPNPVALPTKLPERQKILEMVNKAAKLMGNAVSTRVLKGLDVILGTVVMPYMNPPIEWGEAVESMTDAVVNNRVDKTCGDVRRVSTFLAQRILRQLRTDMLEEKRRQKFKDYIKDEPKDFYDPNKVKES